MRRWHKALAATGVALAVLVPSGVAVAATTNSGNGPAVTRTCTGDQQMLRLRDGTGWRHTAAPGTTVTVQPGYGFGHQYMSGPRDGTGFRWGSSS